jgi:hypothetical protein
MAAWFELYPDRFEKERLALEAAGIEFRIDEALLEKKIVRLTLEVHPHNVFLDLPDPENSYELVVVFPDSYPWFRPEVYAYDLDMPRHHHPIGKNLCLLPRNTKHWDPTITLAELLQTQLRLVLEKGLETNPEKIKADVAEQAEPVSEYYKVENPPILFDPTGLDFTPDTKLFQFVGTIRVGMARGTIQLPRFAVHKTHGSDGREIHSAFQVLEELFPYKLDGILVSAPTPPPFTENMNEVDSWLKEGLKKSGFNVKFPSYNIKFGRGAIKCIIGICFPEEIQAGVQGLGWLFLIECLVPPAPVGGKEKLGASHRRAWYFSKPAFISADARRDRVPNLLPLANKTVSIAGLGALGSFCAIELAKAGVKELRILDFDIVDPPTTVRWQLGMTAAGLYKTFSIQKFIEENYPATKVDVFDFKLGAVAFNGVHPNAPTAPTDDDILTRFLNGSSLLIDATAEEGINYFLSLKAVFSKLPHIIGYATPGAWGGALMKWVPWKKQGCWLCMKYWQNERPELVPPVDFNGQVQPPGCGDITFTGPGFDLQNVSLAMVRMAVSVLCQRQEGYPELTWDLQVLSLMKEEKPIAPEWQTLNLEPHPKCPYCVGK